MQQRLDAPDPKDGLSSGTQTVHKILDDLNKNNKVGCGCTGLIVAAILGAWALGRWWLEGADFGFVLAGLIGAASWAAVRLRGFHIVTALAWLALGALAIAVAPILTGLIFPEAPLAGLPWVLKSRVWAWGIAAASTFALFALMIQMRRTISTAEAFYAIQIKAASNRTDIAQATEHLDAALGLLDECAEAGIWPLGADFLDVDDAPLVPRPGRAPTPAIKPLLAIRVREGEGDTGEGWQTFGARATLTAPEPWTASVPDMAPMSVGQLYADGQRLRYAPLRREIPEIIIDLKDIARLRVHIHALELDTTAGRFTFVGVHLWRAASVALFLRSFEVDLHDTAAALWATGLRADHALGDPTLLKSIPSAQTLRARLQALTPERSGGSEAFQAASEALWPLIDSPRPALRAVADRLIGVLEAIGRGDPDDAHARQESASLWLDAFPDGALSLSVEHLLEDLEGLALLKQRAWAELEAWIDGLPTRDGAVDRRDKPAGSPAAGSDDDAGDTEDPRVEDPRVEDLKDAVAHLARGDKGAAGTSLARARSGWPASLFIEAMEASVRG